MLWSCRRSTVRSGHETKFASDLAAFADTLLHVLLEGGLMVGATYSAKA